MIRPVLSLLVAVIVTTGVRGAPAVAADWSATGHKSISVALSHDAEECGVRSEDAFAKQLRDSLGEAGLRIDPKEALVARLSVSAKPLEALKGQCVAVITLAFVIPMEIDFIEITEKASNREAVLALLEKAREFPIVLYEDSELATAWPTNMHSDALYLVDQLVQRYAGRR